MSVLSTSAQGATFLILFQLASRASTFLVNQILLRYLSPATLGLSAQLDLFARTIISFSRDSVEVAAQRQTGDAQPIVNLAYLSIALGAPLAYTLASLYERGGNLDVPYFPEAIWIYAFSCVVELFATPAYVAAQQRMLFKVKASAESIATLSRCFLTCAVAVVAARRGFAPGVLPFALGQLAFGGMMLAAYLYKMGPLAKKENFSLLLKKMQGNEYILGRFSKRLCNLSLSLFIQNSFKFILTQGDGIMIAGLASLSEQGAYALASNYGGLIARILFQPIEETSRTIFGQLCATQEEERKNTEKKLQVIEADSGSKQASDVKSAKELLQNVLKLYSIIGLVACTIGPSAAPILLRLAAGPQWANTQASSVLVTYCYYIPLLAINGVTEAFVTAVASNSLLHIQSALMGVWFVAFAGATWVFTRGLEMGARGLVLANCVNMVLRIVFNTWFFMGYFKEKKEPFDFSAVLPAPMSIATAVGTWAILQFGAGAELVPNNFLKDLIYHGAVTGIFGLLLLFWERSFFLQWVQPLLGKQFLSRTK